MLAALDLDKEGYLVNPEDWNEDVALELAKSEGIVLTDDYWPLLKYIRHSFLENGIVPDIRHTVGFIVEKQGDTKKSAKKYLFKLFPYLCKAGLQAGRNVSPTRMEHGLDSLIYSVPVVQLPALSPSTRLHRLPPQA